MNVGIFLTVFGMIWSLISVIAVIVCSEGKNRKPLTFWLVALALSSTLFALGTAL
jgi:hypothetical protein